MPILQASFLAQTAYPSELRSQSSYNKKLEVAWLGGKIKIVIPFY